MWTVSMLKENAKAALKNFYWPAFLVSLIFILLTGAGSGSSGGGSGGSSDEFINEYYNNYSNSSDSSYDYGDYSSDDDYDYSYGYDDDIDSSFSQDDYEQIFNDMFSGFDDMLGDTSVSAVISVAIAVIIIVMIVALAYNIFFANPLTVGYNNFFLNARAGNAGVGELFSQFKHGHYMATVKNMFFLKLRLFLWSLLVLIPIGIGILIFAKSDSRDIMGSLVLSILIVIPLYIIALIPKWIKMYEYFLVPYITAENPNITPNRALEISSQTMKGEKMHCFGLQMSFIGWLILGGLAGSIFTAFLGVLLGSAATAAGMALIYPYLYATLAEFYCCMKEKAIATGISSRDELDGLYGRAANAQPFGQPMGYSDHQGYEPYQPTAPSQTSDNGLFGESRRDDNDDNYNGPEIK